MYYEYEKRRVERERIHKARRMTVKQLRDFIQGLPDEMTIVAEVPDDGDEVLGAHVGILNRLDEEQLILKMD